MEKKFEGEYVLTKKLYKKLRKNKLRINKLSIISSILLLAVLIYNFFIVQNHTKAIKYSIVIIVIIILKSIINTIRSSIKYKKIIKENKNKMNYEITISDGIYIKNKETGQKTNCNFRTISAVFKNSKILIAKTKVGDVILIPEKLNGGTENELKQYIVEKTESKKYKRIIGISKYIVLYRLVVIIIMLSAIYINENQKKFMNDIIKNFSEEVYVKDITTEVRGLYNLFGDKKYEVNRYVQMTKNSTNGVMYEFIDVVNAKKTLAQRIEPIREIETTKVLLEQSNINEEKYIFENEKIFQIYIRKGRYLYYSTSNVDDKETVKEFLKTIGWYDEDIIKRVDSYN